MNRTNAIRTLSLSLFLALAAVLASAPAMAKKPSWAGDGQKGDSQKGDSQRVERRDYFEERHRVIVREYYGEQHRSGARCPPGLAKKHNGCMPPGQARKWQIGQPLPRDVVYYEVPQRVVTQFGQPPSGYRYVRVASDILLMAVGTGMIADAIKDLGRT
jgi:Ni/Co efflux regulator RcnB